jgi:hypothetical protein
MTARIAIVIAALASSTLAAQWPFVSNAGRAPRRQGRASPDWCAPAHGRWQSGLLRPLVPRWSRWRRPRRGAGAAPAPTTTPDGIPLSTFGEVAGRGYASAAAAMGGRLKKRRMANNQKDNPDVWCLPIGLMQYHNHGQPTADRAGEEHHADRL